MSLAQFNTPAEIIVASLTAGQRGHRLSETPDGDVLAHISNLLRRSVTRGIVPQWTLRTPLGVTASPEQLAEIADEVDEGFLSGESPIAWRVDVYA